MVQTTRDGVRIQSMVDKLPAKILFGGCLVVSVYLMVMLIIGAAGPDVHKKWSQTSFTCNGTEDYEFHDGCNGTDLALPGATQYISIPPNVDDYSLSPKNFEFSMIMWPYNSKYKEMSGSLHESLKIKTTLYGSNQKDMSDMQTVFDRTLTKDLICPRHRPYCYGFILFVERDIEYPYYRMDAEILESSGKRYVENALWESSTQSIAFNDMQLSFRYIYLFVAIVLLVVWLVMMRRLEFSQWPFEQRGVLFLLIGLVFFNNPLFALHLFAETWFWTFLDEFFQILFVCLLFFFWFGWVEQVRYGYTQSDPQRAWVWYLKAVIVIAYGISASVVAYWLDIKLNRSSELAGLAGVIVFYYFACLFCAAALVWVMIGGVLHIPSGVSKQPHLEVRYLYLALPTTLVAVSMLVGVFSGTFGPFNRTSVSFMYFFGLFNTYVYLLAFGFLPGVLDIGRDFEVQEEGRLIMTPGEVAPSGEVSSENAAKSLAL